MSDETNPTEKTETAPNANAARLAELRELMIAFDPISGGEVRIKLREITRAVRLKIDAELEPLVGKSYDDPDVWPRVRAAIDLGVASPTFDELEQKLTERELVTLACGLVAASRRIAAEIEPLMGSRITVVGTSAAA